MSIRVPTADELTLDALTGVLTDHLLDHQESGDEPPCLDCGPLVLLHDRAAELFGVAHDPMRARGTGVN